MRLITDLTGEDHGDSMSARQQSGSALSQNLHALALFHLTVLEFSTVIVTLCRYLHKHRY